MPGLPIWHLLPLLVEGGRGPEIVIPGSRQMGQPIDRSLNSATASSRTRPWPASGWGCRGGGARVSSCWENVTEQSMGLCDKSQIVDLASVLNNVLEIRDQNKLSPLKP